MNASCVLRLLVRGTREEFANVIPRNLSQSVVVPKLGTTKILVARYKVSYVEGGKYSTGGSTYSKPAIWGGVLNKTCKIKISPPKYTDMTATPTIVKAGRDV